MLFRLDGLAMLRLGNLHEYQNLQLNDGLRHHFAILGIKGFKTTSAPQSTHL